MSDTSGGQTGSARETSAEAAPSTKDRAVRAAEGIRSLGSAQALGDNLTIAERIREGRR